MNLKKTVTKIVTENYKFSKYDLIEKKDILKTRKQEIENSNRTYKKLYKVVVIRYSSDDYDAIVSQLIREKYSADKVEAILSNHLSEIENEHYTNEFNEFQAYRENCKKIAREFIAERKEKLNV